MKDGLSKTVVHRSDKMIPLLQNPEVLLDFDTPVSKQKFFMAPSFIFTLVIILIMILAALTKSRKTIRIIDIFIYSVFSILSVLMIFFNFFTDHQQMKWNLNIIWLNPFIIVCLVMLILNKSGQHLVQACVFHIRRFYCSSLYFAAGFQHWIFLLAYYDPYKELCQVGI